jgi:asparagine synthase (glutamine-hydrolysing)
MCGILGAVRRSATPIPNARVEAALRCIQHRGPDDRGAERIVVSDREVLLGHTRLSIIDLSAGGHQPMRSADGRFVLIFNGEIYNYRELRQQLAEQGIAFGTQSDTEVLLKAWRTWGEACLPRLVGMFAFAILDCERRQLTLARDAFGIKPLFYATDGDDVTFGSEIEPLHVVMGRRGIANLRRAYEYLVYGRYDDDAGTFFDGIFNVPPGHVLTLDLTAAARAEPRRWWWPSIEERGDLSFAQAADQIREHFLANVRLHLRSDVPVGAALSGGIDSSAVVCAIRQLEPTMPLHTFTFVAQGSAIDEESWADIVNAHVGAVPNKVVVSPEDLAHDLDDMIRVQGEPFGSTSIYAQYRVFKAAREAGVIVTLDGQGADELLAGYQGYPSAYLRSLVDRRTFGVAAEFLGRWSRWPGRGALPTLLAVGDVLTPSTFRGAALRMIGVSPEPTWLRGDWLRGQGVVPRALAAAPTDASGHGRRLVEQLRHALTGRGLVQLLRHGDRDSMRWSVESRVPFLTTDFAELVLRLPEAYLLSNSGETKSVFRAAMRGIVPDRILDRRDKIGFQTPEQNWLFGIKHKLTNWMEASERIPFLDPIISQTVVNEIATGARPFNSSAWRLINYCRWTQLFIS